MQTYDVNTRARLLGVGLVLLGAAVAVVAVLGPLVFDVLRYRTSATSMNQIIGGDAAALLVVAPVSVVVEVLAIRGHPAAPVSNRLGRRRTRPLGPPPGRAAPISPPALAAAGRLTDNRD
jgi:hypothetical protein